MTAISALVSFGSSIAAFVFARGTARRLALYACARSSAFLLAAASVSALASLAGLVVIAGCMITVQALDAVIGALGKDRLKSFGPATTAIVNLAALWWLLA